MTSWLRLSSQHWRQEQLDNQPQILLIFCGTNESLCWNKHSSNLFILQKTHCLHKINQYSYSNSVNLSYVIDRCCIDSFRGWFFHANLSRWGWMTVVLGHVVDENQQFWLEGWRCYCIEGHNAARRTEKASKTDLPSPGLYNVISLCRLQFQLEISKGVTAATPQAAAGAARNILDILFSLCQHQPSQETCSHELFTAIIQQLSASAPLLMLDLNLSRSTTG